MNNKLLREIEYKGYRASLLLEDTGGWICDWIDGCNNYERVILSSQFLNCRSEELYISKEKELIANIYERYFKQVIDGL